MTSLGRTIPYVKASACGNDFLIIDGVHATEDWLLSAGAFAIVTKV